MYVVIAFFNFPLLSLYLFYKIIFAFNGFRVRLVFRLGTIPTQDRDVFRFKDLLVRQVLDYSK